MPAHWPVEVVSLLWSARRAGRISVEAMAAGIRGARTLATATAPGNRFDWARTMEIADRNRLTVYDAAYLHIAIDVGATLGTNDKDLLRAAGECGVEAITTLA
jgi:predicted nucleic acid-binding protein